MVRKNISRASGSEPLWRNVMNTYRRFNSDEIAGARVQATYRDSVVETVTDDEGYFQVRLEPRELASHVLWHEVNLALPESEHTAVAHVLLPSEAAQFAIISDIDDTVLVTNATSLLGMARSVIRNAASRLPFEGVADLYRALHRDVNPIFYVSSSPWNLYELLHDFMDLNGIPHGPMFLQDWGIDEKTLILASHTEHKLARIQAVVDYYPALRFVLIGDSGQHDPEIYLEVIRAHPNRVLAVFIRNVSRNAARIEDIERLAVAVSAAGSSLVLAADSVAMAEQAARLGLVPQDTPHLVRCDRAVEASPAEPEPAGTGRLSRATPGATARAVEGGELKALLEEKPGSAEGNVIVEADTAVNGPWPADPAKSG
jgi:phosphatidate phosphatase APP1